MQLCQELCIYSDNVSPLISRTITFAPSARRRALPPAIHSTTLCLILSIASTSSLTLYKQSEATPRNAPTYTTILVFAHLSFLFSILGSLSSKLIPVIRTTFHNHPTFFEGPGRPASTVVIRSQMHVGMLDMPHHPPVPPWLNQAEFMGLFFNVTVYLRRLAVLHSPDLGVQLHVWTGFCSGGQWLYGPTACSVAWRRLRTSSRFIPWTS